MDNIVKYLFDRYYGKEINFAELRRELESKTQSLSNNDIAVLGCYCETDVEATLLLHEINNVRMASEFKGEQRMKFAFLLLCTEIQNCAIPLDRHFKCHRFVPLIVSTWKRILNREWTDLLLEGKDACKTLKFFQPILDNYLK